jgi:hypothetical protein
MKAFLNYEILIVFPKKLKYKAPAVRRERKKRDIRRGLKC